ncbi:3-oxoacyl-[acyl-carrier-protein] synthase III C-terminal domain-containing protein [Streptomyces sp. NPDC050704]|uniref:3-oxoacyl-[acyl-carrier-protein] synthase III C-terminal domain-containing protein n=1 Tax=Streptomyces sp. NPDC050704 TaxID=3157219 RepID=UPI0034252150
MTAISAVHLALPDTVTPVTALPEYPGLSDADRALVDGLGITSVGEAPGTGSSELAARAVRELLDARGLDGGEVDALLLIGGRVPDYFVASEATRVQHEAGLTGALSLTVTDLGCAASSAALLTARALLESTPAWRRVVIAHGCRPAGPRRLRKPVTVNGDAGMAVLVEPHGGMRIVDMVMETDGRYWDLFRVEYRDRPHQDWQEVCVDEPRYSFSLAVESQKRFTALNERLLARQRLSLADVDHFVMQNLSEGAYRFYEEGLGITFAAVCRDNLRRYGHLGPIDILANLRDGVESGELAPGDLVLVMNNSPVAAWSSTLIEV